MLNFQILWKTRDLKRFKLMRQKWQDLPYQLRVYCYNKAHVDELFVHA